jgi:hypothetical protein
VPLPSREAGDKLYREMVEEAGKRDANDLLYATEAVMDYDPSGDIGKIKARLLAINSADDEILAKGSRARRGRHRTLVLSKVIRAAKGLDKSTARGTRPFGLL